MKKILLLMTLLPVFFQTFAQKVSGNIKDESGKTLPGITIQILNTHLGSVSDSEGRFTFSHLKSGRHIFKFTGIGFEEKFDTLNIGSDNVSCEILMKSSDYLTDEVTVSALTADKFTPIAFTNLDVEAIAQSPAARDIPYVLDMTPSVVSNSDAGAGVGYTTLRIRGTDVSRINVTMDGIPVNDAESHGVWWVDMPDYSASSDEIQIQRGVGTSTNGAGAFGANINFRTNVLKKIPYAQADFFAGSFNTFKTSLKAGTGLLNSRFGVDFRLSKISSDGYIDRAKSDLKSYFISGFYLDKKNALRINIFQGLENTYQAWGGVPKDSLSTNRTYNPYTYENEIDRYNQTNYHALYSREVSANMHINLALHYTKGFGYYEQFKEDEAFSDYGLAQLEIGDSVIENTDLIRRKWLDNDFYGIVYSLNYKAEKFRLTFGGSANRYEGAHFGQIIWAQYASDGFIRHEWYRNNGMKDDFNNYLKVSFFPVTRINLWGDFQYRKIDYRIEGLHESRIEKDLSQNWNFYNPKAGATWTINDKQNAYFSFAVANREPSRSDFDDADAEHQPRPETLYDYEAGYRFQSYFVCLELGLFYMDYKDQLVLTGEINNVGAPIKVNVAKSYRTGLEVALNFRLTDRLSWNLNSTYSENKIPDFTEYVDNWNYWGDPENQSIQIENKIGTTDITFSPKIVAGSSLSYEIFKNFSLSLNSKYVGLQYIDNTASKDRSIDPYFVNNLIFDYQILLKKAEKISLRFEINNILNEKYETNAWVYRYYSGENYGVYDGFFPQAGINFTGGISIKF